MGQKNGVYAFDYNSAENEPHYEHIVGGWPCQIVGAIRAVATVCAPCRARRTSFRNSLNNVNLHIYTIY